MTIKWVNNKYGGQKDGYIGAKRIFIAQQNSYGRKLWQFEHIFNGRISRIVTCLNIDIWAINPSILEPMSKCLTGLALNIYDAT